MTAKLFFKMLVLAAFLTVQPLSAQKLISQAAHLKNFYECFAVKNSDINELELVRKLIEDPPCFRLCWLTNPQGYFKLAFFPQHFSEELRNCYYSQSAIRGAMKMYNAEHTVPLRRLTSAMVNHPDSPLMPDYLKHPFPKPSPSCSYESIGDLIRGDLAVYCTFHGAPTGEIKAPTRK